MTNHNLIRWIQIGLIALVAIMPFHAFLSVWLGHLFGHQALWQAWKEALLILLTMATVWLVVVDPSRRRRLKEPAVIAIGVFALITLAVTAVTRPDLTPMLFGLKTDLEFLLAAVLAVVVSDKLFLKRLIITVLASSGAVIVFGLLQIWVLPRDWLVHFGYGPSTVEPYLLVDPAINSVRIISTLGGTNQLGSFLILPICLAVWLFLRRPRWWQPLYAVAGTIVLWHTYARSAALGLAAGLGILVLIKVRRAWRMPLLLVATILVAAGLSLITNLAGSNRSIQYYVFHQSLQDSGYAASTDQHLAAYTNGVKRLSQDPWGNGAGTAGPASFHGKAPFIPENYYLQLGFETGLLGLLVFVAMEIIAGIGLWKRAATSALAPAVVAALAGVSIVNLFLHGWTDSSTALIAWTSIGAVLGVPRT